jgi:hypothetical protein
MDRIIVLKIKKIIKNNNHFTIAAAKLRVRGVLGVWSSGFLWAWERPLSTYDGHHNKFFLK